MSETLITQGLLILLNVEEDDNSFDYDHDDQFIKLRNELKEMLSEIYQLIEANDFYSEKEKEKIFIEYMQLLPKFTEFCRDKGQIPYADYYMDIVKLYRTALFRVATDQINLFMLIDKKTRELKKSGSTPTMDDYKHLSNCLVFQHEEKAFEKTLNDQLKLIQRVQEKRKMDADYLPEFSIPPHADNLFDFRLKAKLAIRIRTSMAKTTPFSLIKARIAWHDIVYALEQKNAHDKANAKRSVEDSVIKHYKNLGIKGSAKELKNTFKRSVKRIEHVSAMFHSFNASEINNALQYSHLRNAHQVQNRKDRKDNYMQVRNDNEKEMYQFLKEEGQGLIASGKSLQENEKTRQEGEELEKRGNALVKLYDEFIVNIEFRPNHAAFRFIDDSQGLGPIDAYGRSFFLFSKLEHWANWPIMPGQAYDHFNKLKKPLKPVTLNQHTDLLLERCNETPFGDERLYGIANWAQKGSLSNERYSVYSQQYCSNYGVNNQPHPHKPSYVEVHMEPGRFYDRNRIVHAHFNNEEIKEEEIQGITDFFESFGITVTYGPNPYPELIVTFKTAIIENNVEVVKHLIGKFPVLNLAGNEAGQIPLIVAIEKGHLDIVAALSDKNRLMADVANPTIIDSHGYNALYYAAINDKQDILTILLKNCGDEDIFSPFENGKNLIQIAIEKGKLAIASMLIRKVFIVLLEKELSLLKLHQAIHKTIFPHLRKAPYFSELSAEHFEKYDAKEIALYIRNVLSKIELFSLNDLIDQDNSINDYAVEALGDVEIFDKVLADTNFRMAMKKISAGACAMLKDDEIRKKILAGEITLDFLSRFHSRHAIAIVKQREFFSDVEVDLLAALQTPEAVQAVFYPEIKRQLTVKIAQELNQLTPEGLTALANERLRQLFLEEKLTAEQLNTVDLEVGVSQKVLLDVKYKHLVSQQSDGFITDLKELTEDGLMALEEPKLGELYRDNKISVSQLNLLGVYFSNHHEADKAWILKKLEDETFRSTIREKSVLLEKILNLNPKRRALVDNKNILNILQRDRQDCFIQHIEKLHDNKKELLLLLANKTIKAAFLKNQKNTVQLIANINELESESILAIQQKPRIAKLFVTLKLRNKHIKQIKWSNQFAIDALKIRGLIPALLAKPATLTFKTINNIATEFALEALKDEGIRKAIIEGALTIELLNQLQTESALNAFKLPSIQKAIGKNQALMSAIQLLNPAGVTLLQHENLCDKFINRELTARVLNGLANNSFTISAVGTIAGLAETLSVNSDLMKSVNELTSQSLDALLNSKPLAKLFMLNQLSREQLEIIDYKNSSAVECMQLFFKIKKPDEKIKKNNQKIDIGLINELDKNGLAVLNKAAEAFEQKDDNTISRLLAPFSNQESAITSWALILNQVNSENWYAISLMAHYGLRQVFWPFLSVPNDKTSLIQELNLLNKHAYDLLMDEELMSMHDIKKIIKDGKFKAKYLNLPFDKNGRKAFQYKEIRALIFKDELLPEQLNHVNWDNASVRLVLTFPDVSQALKRAEKPLTISELNQLDEKGANNLQAERLRKLFLNNALKAIHLNSIVPNTPLETIVCTYADVSEALYTTSVDAEFFKLGSNALTAFKNDKVRKAFIKGELFSDQLEALNVRHPYVLKLLGMPDIIKAVKEKQLSIADINKIEINGYRLLKHNENVRSLLVKSILSIEQINGLFYTNPFAIEILQSKIIQGKLNSMKPNTDLIDELNELDAESCRLLKTHSGVQSLILDGKLLVKHLKEIPRIHLLNDSGLRNLSQPGILKLFSVGEIEVEEVNAFSLIKFNQLSVNGINAIKYKKLRQLFISNTIDATILNLVNLNNMDVIEEIFIYPDIVEALANHTSLIQVFNNLNADGLMTLANKTLRERLIKGAMTVDHANHLHTEIARVLVCEHAVLAEALFTHPMTFYDELNQLDANAQAALDSEELMLYFLKQELTANHLNTLVRHNQNAIAAIKHFARVRSSMRSQADLIKEVNALNENGLNNLNNPLLLELFIQHKVSAAMFNALNGENDYAADCLSHYIDQCAPNLNAELINKLNHLNESQCRSLNNAHLRQLFFENKLSNKLLELIDAENECAVKAFVSCETILCKIILIPEFVAELNQLNLNGLEALNIPEILNFFIAGELSAQNINVLDINNKAAIQALNYPMVRVGIKSRSCSLVSVNQLDGLSMGLLQHAKTMQEFVGKENTDLLQWTKSYILRHLTLIQYRLTEYHEEVSKQTIFTEGRKKKWPDLRENLLDMIESLLVFLKQADVDLQKVMHSIQEELIPNVSSLKSKYTGNIVNLLLLIEGDLLRLNFIQNEEEIKKGLDRWLYFIDLEMQKLPYMSYVNQVKRSWGMKDEQIRSELSTAQLMITQLNAQQDYLLTSGDMNASRKMESSNHRQNYSLRWNDCMSRFAKLSGYHPGLFTDDVQAKSDANQEVSMSEVTFSIRNSTNTNG